jgi:hypothetical protein
MKSNLHFDANLNVGFSTATIFNVLFKDETLTSSRQHLWFAVSIGFMWILTMLGLGVVSFSFGDGAQNGGLRSKLIDTKTWALASCEKCGKHAY